MRALPAIFLLTACATTQPASPKGGPRGLHANEHLDAAHAHDEAAARASSWPASTAMTPGELPGATASPQLAWTRSWDTAAEHERFAAIHRSRAAAIQAGYEEACGTRPVDQVSISPLQRYGVGGWNTSTGVILYLSPAAADADRLLADLKCHRAWMMLAAAGMDDCPLDLPGLQLDVRGNSEGVTVSLAVRDPKLVRELQRRAAHDLEAAQSLQSPGSEPR